MQILPRFDPGGEVGRSIGSGFGNALNIQADRKRLQSGLDALDNLDLENMSYGDIIKAGTRALGGYPGGMQALGDILPGLLKQKQSYDYGNSFPDEEPGMANNTRGMANNNQAMANNQNREGGRPELAPLSQKVPGLEEDITAYTPLSNQERKAMALRMAKGGFNPKEIQESINLEEQRRKDVWKGNVEAKKARTEQFAEERALEDTQEDRVRSYIAEEAGVAASQLDPYEIQKGYELFKEEQGKSPKLKDRQIWNKVRQKYNQMRNSFSKGKELLTRPGYFSTNVDKKLENAREWAQSHLKNYGNFKQDRDKLMTLFTQNGFSKAEAASMVKPISKGLEETVKSMGRGSRSTYAGSGDIGGISTVPLKGKEREDYLEKLSDGIAKNLTKDDSILLLRERLVRDKGMNERDFTDALTLAQKKMEEQGKALNAEQKEELPDLQEMVMPSLFDVFFGDEKWDLKKYIPRLAK